MIKHASLFSGGGGIDLAAEMIGWDNVFHCEIEQFQRNILEYYWPLAESFSDIKKSNFNKYAHKIDILSGGFPCQPWSVAGKRKGKDDPRHLWPEMLRAIREIQPTYVVGENVPGIITWNSGLVFKDVFSDLGNEGFEVACFVLPALAKKAPHRRDRTWFVAYSEANRVSRRMYLADTNGIGIDTVKRAKGDNMEGGHPEDKDKKWGAGECKTGRPFDERPASDTNWKRFKGCKQQDVGKGEEPKDKLFDRLRGEFFSPWEQFPTESPVCGTDDGLSTRLDGITFPKWRRKSIETYGNAVVPQLVYDIFNVIQKHHEIVSYGKDQPAY